ncbi:hypothetical protein [Roseateles saccharophilus]|nr:hypothetical protein [Roseateles saccharophilus]
MDRPTSIAFVIRVLPEGEGQPQPVALDASSPLLAALKTER